jgi:hypothetical protein
MYPYSEIMTEFFPSENESFYLRSIKSQTREMKINTHHGEINRTQNSKR